MKYIWVVKLALHIAEINNEHEFTMEDNFDIAVEDYFLGVF